MLKKYVLIPMHVMNKECLYWNHLENSNCVIGKDTQIAQELRPKIYQVIVFVLLDVSKKTNNDLNS